MNDADEPPTRDLYPADAVWASRLEGQSHRELVAEAVALRRMMRAVHTHAERALHGPWVVRFHGRSLAERLLVVAAVSVLLNVVLLAMPGHYSGDELGWMHRIERGADPWGLDLASLSDSMFFRPLGTLVISAALRLPMQPFGSHAALVLLQALNCCALYLLVGQFRPGLALAAAVLFAIMPGTAYVAAWVAAFFDMLWLFFGMWSLTSAVIFWRRGYPIWGLAAWMAFAAALLCKETALTIPLAAVLLAFCDRAQVDWRRLSLLAVATVCVIVAYAALRTPAMLHLGHTGTGGYGFGGISNIKTNMLAYFGFPFAAFGMAEITGFTDRSLDFILVSIALHILFVAALVLKNGVVAAPLYLVAYYIPLLPVLIISKYETQYLYGSSAVMSVALAFMWDRRLLSAIPTGLLALLLVIHGLTVQQTMYATGACQTRLIETTAAMLPFVRPPLGPVVYSADDGPWWIAARAYSGEVFPVDNKDIHVTLKHDPAGASMRFLQDCRVVLQNPG